MWMWLITVELLLILYVVMLWLIFQLESNNFLFLFTFIRLTARTWLSICIHSTIYEVTVHTLDEICGTRSKPGLFNHTPNYPGEHLRRCAVCSFKKSRKLRFLCRNCATFLCVVHVVVPTYLTHVFLTRRILTKYYFGIYFLSLHACMLSWVTEFVLCFDLCIFLNFCSIKSLKTIYFPVSLIS